MKILIVSDSHGDVENMCRAVEITRPERIIHLGDGWRDAAKLHERFPAIPLDQVRGNCDIGCEESAEKLLTLGGKRLFLCHGHTQHVKYGLLSALYTAREQEADALLFGHTHQPLVDFDQGVMLLNPGSIGERFRPTYGVLTIENGQCLPATYRL